MYGCGWYPFVSEIYNDNFIYENVVKINKDEIIFQLLVLEKEINKLDFLDLDIDTVKEKIKMFKGKL
jgi:hypothetical protein